MVMIKYLPMDKKKIYTIIFASIFAICAFALIWSWWVTREIRSDVQNALNKSQQVEVKNLVLTETKDGKKYWELYAKTGEYDSGSGLVNLNAIIGNFYNKDEEDIRILIHEYAQELIINLKISNPELQKYILKEQEKFAKTVVQAVQRGYLRNLIVCDDIYYQD